MKTNNDIFCDLEHRAPLAKAHQASEIGTFAPENGQVSTQSDCIHLHNPMWLLLLLAQRAISFQNHYFL